MVRTPAPLLDLRSVTVVRGSNVALNGVSLRIEVGEHVCILGPNGCGKSTLIKAITRGCYPLAQEGSSIAILGRSLWNIFALRSLLGIVSPDLLAACTTDATGLDVVLSGFFSSTRIFPNHKPEAEHRERAETALARLGVAHLAARPVLEMSSGEAKRTLIARALVHDPQTLLFDEPGNTLDIRGTGGTARDDAGTGTLRIRDSFGDAPRFGNYSGDRAGGAPEAGTDTGRRTQESGAYRQAALCVIWRESAALS